MPVDGVPRRPNVWPDWSVSVHVEAGDYAPVAQLAISCHQSRLPGYGRIDLLLNHHQRELCNLQTYYRVYRLLNRRRGLR